MNFIDSIHLSFKVKVEQKIIRCYDLVFIRGIEISIKMNIDYDTVFCHCSIQNLIASVTEKYPKKECVINYMSTSLSLQI